MRSSIICVYGSRIHACLCGNRKSGAPRRKMPLLHESADLLLGRRAADRRAAVRNTLLVEDHDAIEVPFHVAVGKRIEPVSQWGIWRRRRHRVRSADPHPGNVSLARAQSGWVEGPFTLLFANILLPGALLGRPFLTQNSAACFSGSSCPPNWSQGKRRISSFSPNALCNSEAIL
jgi:hypothetical protein